MTSNKEIKLLGQDLDVIVAVLANIISWFVKSYFPQYIPKLLPLIPNEHDANEAPTTEQTRCVAIGRPGGTEQLRMITLKPHIATVGYNVKVGGPFVDLRSEQIPSGTVSIRVEAFSVNFADCAIRWGLYESANKHVGWPICPGFDIAGVVETVYHDENGERLFDVGDRVFGATFFGAYSTRVLVPEKQLRKIPDKLTMPQAASLPAVSLTALYALYLGGKFPKHEYAGSDRSILVHSAAGGVGGMVIQMSRLLGLSPIVGVVGHSSKVEEAISLGCDVVIDKSQEDLWKAARCASPEGYSVIMDANGVSTLSQSYAHLSQTGRLITFGFHTNLPMGQDMLSPLEWLKMTAKLIKMPKFDAMDLTTSNKSILGFNLSFFVDEIDMLAKLFDQISDWINSGRLSCPRITEIEMSCIKEAHELIQSGRSVGKIILNC